jgi:hypothetical protein
MDFNKFGINNLTESNTFKKIQYFTKVNSKNIYNLKIEYSNLFNKVNNLYNNDLTLQNSYSYGVYRQHTYNSMLSNINYKNTLLDQQSINKYLNYNYNISHNPKSMVNDNEINFKLNNFFNLNLYNNNKGIHNYFNLNNNVLNLTKLNDLYIYSNKNIINYFSSNFNKSFKEIDLKSKNLEFINNDRNIRNLKVNNLSNLDYKNNFINLNFLENLTSNNTNITINNIPLISNLKFFDKVYNKEKDLNPILFKNKIEVSPNYVFNTY